MEKNTENALFMSSKYCSLSEFISFVESSTKFLIDESFMFMHLIKLDICDFFSGDIPFANSYNKG